MKAVTKAEAYSANEVSQFPRLSQDTEQPTGRRSGWKARAGFIGATAATAGSAMAGGSTVTVPTITFPTGFDIPGMLTSIVTNNASFILGGVAVTSMLYIVGKAVMGIRGGAGRIASGGH